MTSELVIHGDMVAAGVILPFRLSHDHSDVSELPFVPEVVREPEVMRLVADTPAEPQGREPAGWAGWAGDSCSRGG